MARFYKTSTPQSVDYVYNMPAQFMMQGIQAADTRVNQLQDQSDLFESTASSVPLQVLSEYKDEATKAVQPYIQEIDNYAKILNEGDAKEYLRQQNKLRTIGKGLSKELSSGKASVYVNNTRAYNDYVKKLMDDKTVDPELRKAILNSRYESNGFINQQITKSLQDGGGLALPEVPQFYDIKKELRDAAKEFGLDESEISSIVSNANNLPGYFTQLTQTNKTIDANKAATVFEGILNDPRQLAIESFRDNYLGQKYVQVGTNTDGTPQYASNPRYVESKVNDLAKTYGYANIAEHYNTVQKPFQNQLDVLNNKLKNNKITKDEYDDEVKKVGKGLQDAVRPLQEKYDAVRNIALNTTSPENAMTGRDLRRQQLMGYWKGILPGETRKEQLKFIKDEIGMENLKFGMKVKEAAQKFEYDKELEQLKQEGKLDQLRWKNYYDGLNTGDGTTISKQIANITPGSGGMISTNIYNPNSFNYINLRNQNDTNWRQLEQLTAQYQAMPDTEGNKNTKDRLRSQIESLNITYANNKINLDQSVDQVEYARQKDKVRKSLYGSVYTMYAGHATQYGSMEGGNWNASVKEAENVEAVFTDATFDKLLNSPTIVRTIKEASQVTGIPESMLNTGYVKAMTNFQTDGMQEVTKQYWEEAKGYTKDIPGLVLNINDQKVNSSLTVPLLNKNYTMKDSDGNDVQFKVKQDGWFKGKRATSMKDFLISSNLTIKDILGTNPIMIPSNDPSNVTFQLDINNLPEGTDIVSVSKDGATQIGDSKKSARILIDIPRTDLSNQQTLFGSKLLDVMSQTSLDLINNPSLNSIRNNVMELSAKKGEHEVINRIGNVKLDMNKVINPVTGNFEYQVYFMDLNGQPIKLPGKSTNMMDGTRAEQLPYMIYDMVSKLHNTPNQTK